jgi:hypothetical protein
MKKSLIYRYRVYGSKQYFNLFWALILFLGSLYLFSIGFSSYLENKGIFLFDEFLTISFNISFFPQGLVMCFYGIIGLFISFYLFLNIVLKIGVGFNEFNKKENIIRIFRWGFPGKNRRLEFCYSIDDIKSIKIFTTSRQTIYVCFKGDMEIPLIRLGQLSSIVELENQAINISRFLGVPLTYV